MCLKYTALVIMLKALYDLWNYPRQILEASWGESAIRKAIATTPASSYAKLEPLRCLRPVTLLNNILVPNNSLFVDNLGITGVVIG